MNNGRLWLACYAPARSKRLDGKSRQGLFHNILYCFSTSILEIISACSCRKISTDYKIIGKSINSHLKYEYSIYYLKFFCKSSLAERRFPIKPLAPPFFCVCSIPNSIKLNLIVYHLPFLS